MCVFTWVVGKFITVGWGKKETQFHGSEGKQAAQKKMLVCTQCSTSLDYELYVCVCVCVCVIF